MTDDFACPLDHAGVSSGSTAKLEQVSDPETDSAYETLDGFSLQCDTGEGGDTRYAFWLDPGSGLLRPRVLIEGASTPSTKPGLKIPTDTSTDPDGP